MIADRFFSDRSDLNDQMDTRLDRIYCCAILQVKLDAKDHTTGRTKELEYVLC